MKLLECLDRNHYIVHTPVRSERDDLERKVLEISGGYFIVRRLWWAETDGSWMLHKELLYTGADEDAAVAALSGEKP